MAVDDLSLRTDDVGTRFVTLVVIMMTTLATLAVGGSLIVGALRATWVDAVKGNLTIELPASDGKGIVRTQDTLAQNAAAISAKLASTKGVSSVHVLSRQEVENLVKPWLGEQAGTDDLPLPALIGVTLANPDDADLVAAVGNAATSADAAAQTQTHQNWISDLRRFSLVLLLAAGAMAAFTIACSILTVAGAVQARLSEHHADIDLLHLMGATDSYIGAQFVRVIVKSVGGAAAIGTAIGALLLKLGGMVAGEIQSAVLPSHGWSALDMLAILALPALVTGLCFVAARVTVLRTLRVMP